MTWKSALLLILCSAGLPAADSDFNGRWNIHVSTPRGRVWWLEVKGAGTASIQGGFIGAPGGQLDPLRDATIEAGVLTFSFERRNSSRDPNSPLIRQRFQARLEGGELRGTRVDEAGASLPWRGVRAPEIADRDSASWKNGKTVELFDGSTTSGWRKVVPVGPGWYVEGGLLKNEKGASDIASEAKFWNFQARAEYRYAQGSNSGIGLRGRYEIQIYDTFGKPPDMHSSGALYSRIPPSVNAAKAPGEWQVMEIRLVGRDLTVTLNGVTVIEKRVVEGPTAITTDPDEDKPGPFVLQGDG
ncbi:MAG: DUF1080 domain-containing protein [Acidobacteria bacterium]|nr:DUF1080 domain-containing protein [Acidobacteriota bacterium]